MDLLHLLEIDQSAVPQEAQRSLLLADRIWRERGAPRDRAGLCAALEEILRRCVSSGIWYAPVLLQRKKAIERGTWRPLRPQAARPAPTARSAGNAAAGPAQPGEQACRLCGGSGVLNAPGTYSGTLCECGAYLRRYARARNTGS